MKKINLLKYFIVFAISIILYISVMIIAKTYPFGGKCFLYNDAYDQYNNMLRMLINWFNSSDKSMFLWDRGLGVDMYLTMIYYLLSPFNVIAIWLGESHVELALIIIIVIKSSFISVSSLYFFNNTNKRDENKSSFILSNIVPMVFALALSFCGYVLAYNHNIIWLDGMIILPILAIAIEKMIETGAYKAYVIWLAISMIVNFYYSIYLCLFAAIYFFIELCGKNILKKILKFIGCSVLSALISSIVLVPAALCILNVSDSTYGISQTGLQTFGDIGEFFSSFYPFKEITISSFFNNNNYISSAAFMLAIMGLASRTMIFNKRIRYICAISILILGLNWVKLNYVLHGMVITHGMGNRFAIILSFILLAIAYDFVNHLEKCSYVSLVMAMIITAGVYAISIVCPKEMGAPLGYILFICIAVLVFILMILLKKKSIKAGTVYIWIGLLIFGEVVTHVFVVAPEKTNETSLLNEIKFEAWSDTYDNLQMSAGERKTALISENYTPKTMVNWYSSMANGYTVDMFKSMGMYHFDNVEYDYAGTTPLSAMLYNVRYIMSNEKGLFGGYNLIEENDTYSLYEAENLAGIGRMVPSNICDWKAEGLPLENQNELISILNGRNLELFTEMPLEDKYKGMNCAEVIKEENGHYIYKKNTSAFSPNVQFEFVSENDDDLYLWCIDRANQIVTVSIDGNQVVHTTYSNTEYIVHIGKVKKGQTIKINVYGMCDYNQISEKYIKLYSYNTELFDSVKEKLTREIMDFGEYNKNTFSGHVSSKSGGVLWMAFPYNKGFTIYDNGQETKQLEIGSGFMGIEIAPGEHDIKIEYHTPGLKPGLCISLFGMAIFISLIIIERKKKNKIEEE